MVYFCKYKLTYFAIMESLAKLSRRGLYIVDSDVKVLEKPSQILSIALSQTDQYNNTNFAKTRSTKNIYSFAPNK